ncbi:DNA mismatch repair enzyme (ATPase) [Clostridium perfringens]
MNKIKVVYYTIFEYRGENMENFISILNSNYLYKEVIKNVIDPLEIIREAISNSIDAEARNIEIRIFKNENSKFSISIKDNGNGMNYEEIQSFFNLGYSKDVNDGKKGFGINTFLKCDKLIVESKKMGSKTVLGIIDKPFENLISGKLPSYELHSIDKNTRCGTTIIIENYYVKNPNKYFNIETLKDYILWFTAAGSFKNIFSNNLEVSNDIKNINIIPRIFLKDDICDSEEEFIGIHKFHREQENPKKNIKATIYIKSSNYCKHFGPYYMSTMINGEYISFQMYGTVSGKNCRGNLAVLRNGEKLKDRFGIYLSKDFVPVCKIRELIPTVDNSMFHLLLNSQNFELSFDKRNVVNLEDDRIKWILECAKNIIERKILPKAYQCYYTMIKNEQTQYLDRRRRTNIDLTYSYFREDLYNNNLAVKKEPHDGLTLLFLFISFLSSKEYKKYLNGLDKIVTYSNNSLFDLVCEDKNLNLKTVLIEYLLKSSVRSIIEMDFDYIICWEFKIKEETLEDDIEIFKTSNIFKIRYKNRKDVIIIKMKNIINI